MGYHVHILRTKNGAPDPISEEEISSAISGEPELHFTGNCVERNKQFFLSYDNGELWLKNPEERDMIEMVSIAEKIGARVRGDELETYTSTGQAYIHKDDEQLVLETEKLNANMRRDTKRRQYLLNICIFGSFSLFLIVFNYLGWLS